MHTQDARNLTEELKDYLRGMRGARPAQLAELAAFENWQLLAQRELERRAARVLEMLDDELVAAIASGDLRAAETMREVLNEPVG